MQIVLVSQQRGDFGLMPGRNEFWRGECLFEILDDVVAFDVHRAVMHQDRYQPARIDAEKPGLKVLIRREVDGMRLPWDALEVEKDAQLL